MINLYVIVDVQLRIHGSYDRLTKVQRTYFSLQINEFKTLNQKFNFKILGRQNDQAKNVYSSRGIF